jgi:hypothetical protein
MKNRILSLLKMISAYKLSLLGVFFLIPIILSPLARASESMQPSPSTEITNSISPEPVFSPMPDTYTMPSFQGKNFPTPAGPVINVSFGIPGIGSGGGTLNPVTKKRNLRILLYASNVNSSLKDVKPLHIINTYAYYDNNPFSPTYTSFINPSIDLGADVHDSEKSQIVLQTDKALTKLVKDKDNNVGGAIYPLYKYGNSIIPRQTFLMGDIAPAPYGNNIIDINDFNLLINCSGGQMKTKTCPDPLVADINDDGVVDGLDYNLMLLSFKTLKSMGFPVPSLFTTPTPWILPTTIKKNIVTVQPSLPKKQTVSSSNGKSNGIAAGLFGLLFFIMLFAFVGFVLYKKNGKFRDFVQNILHRSPAVKPAPEKTNGVQPPSDTSIPVQSAEGQIVEGDYYVKKQSVDEKNAGLWLTLTGDSGPVAGYYKAAEVTEGFAKIKGEMKKDGEHTYILVSEIIPDE